jgi:hypothetical protein
MARTRHNKAQLGCLVALLLFVLLVAAVEFFGTHPPGDDEGGAPIAVLGILGLVLFFLSFATIGIARAIASRTRRAARASHRATAERCRRPPG